MTQTLAAPAAVSRDELIATALEYVAAGLAVLPASVQAKRPATKSWKQYVDQPPDADVLQSLFSVEGGDGVCILCGPPSGGLEVFDFDLGARAYDAWAGHVRDHAPGLLDKLVIQTTQRGGRHVCWRCETPAGNSRKLARVMVDGKPQTVIETRGSGGLIIAAPSEGYTVVQGDFRDLPTLTDDERRHLWSAATALDEVGAAGREQRQTSDRGAGSAPCRRPRRNAGRRTSTGAAIRGRFWRTPVGRWPAFRGRMSFGVGPAKHPVILRTFHVEQRTFHNFSSNADPFREGEAYSPFAVTALLEHGGDFEAAARALRNAGFGGDGGAAVDG